MTDARLRITAEDGFSAVFRRAKSELRDLQGFASRAGNVLGSLGGAFGVLGSLTVGSAVAGLTQLIGAIDDLDEAAQGVGLTATALGDLRQGAIEAGVASEQFDDALTRLNVKLGEAASGNQDAARLFRALGVEFKDAGGKMRGTEEVLRDVADRFSQLENGPAKAALAVEIFGKSGSKLIAFLNQGGDGLSRFSGLTRETVEEAQRAQQEIDRWSANWARFKNELAGGVLPAVNDFIDTVRRVDLQKLGPVIVGPVGALTALQEWRRASVEVESRQRQLMDALALGAGAYSNEGRAAKQSAEAILANARAKDENTRANERSRQSSLGGVFDAEFRDANRVRENRRRLQDAIDAENAAARDRELRRIDDVFGVTEARETSEILAIINAEVQSGRRTAEEAEAAWDRAFGKPMQDKLKETKDLTEELSLTFASSVGRFIETGGGVDDFFKSLLQDVTKLIVQLSIVKPLAEEIQRAFSSGGASSTSWLGYVLQLFGGAVGGGAGAAAGGSVGTGTSSAGGPVRATSIVIHNHIGQIGSGVSRAEVASAMQQSSDLTIAKIRDQAARGRLQLA